MESQLLHALGLITAALSGVIGVLVYLVRKLFDLHRDTTVRVDRIERALRTEQEKTDRLERFLERAGNGYGAVRKLLLRIVVLLRAGKTVREDLLTEAEGVPDFHAVLRDPAEVA